MKNLIRRYFRYRAGGWAPRVCWLQAMDDYAKGYLG